MRLHVDDLHVPFDLALAAIFECRADAIGCGPITPKGVFRIVTARRGPLPYAGTRS